MHQWNHPKESERGCGQHLHTNGSLSKVKEQMIGALCLGAVLQKDWADVVEVWHWLGKAVNGHTNGLVFLSLLTVQLRSLSMSETHTHEWPQRSRVNKTHCAHGKRNRKHLDSQCADCWLLMRKPFIWRHWEDGSRQSVGSTYSSAYP